MKRLIQKITVLTIILNLAGVPLTFATEKKEAASPTLTPVEKAVAARGGVNINTATKDKLKDLPGIDDAYARKIIAGRPYSKKDELKAKKIVCASIYEMIKYQIVAN